MQSTKSRNNFSYLLVPSKKISSPLLNRAVLDGSGILHLLFRFPRRPPNERSDEGNQEKEKLMSKIMASNQQRKKSFLV